MAEEAPPNPEPSSEQKDKDCSNPDIKEEQQMNKDHNESTQQSPPNDTNTTDLNDQDIENIENIYHQRQNDVSQNKLKPILKELISVVNKKEKQQENIAKDQKEQADPYVDNDEKHNTQKETLLRINHGHCSRQGMRQTMEDQVVVESTLNLYGSKCTSGQLSLYGVFDGHGGTQCAEFCAAHLIETLSPYLLAQDSVITAFTLAISDLDSQAIKSAKDASGSTCCIVLIDNKSYDLWCCNVGDSRCILINNECTKVEQLSIEHKPDYPLEKQRIENANGWVTFGRVCGILAVSRSLGDKDFKYEIENLVISTPDVSHRQLVLDEDMFIVLACDGLFDVFSNEQCMHWMKTHKEIEIQQMTQQLNHDAIHVRKSKDNVSILILRIDHIEVDIEEDVEDEDEDINVNLNDYDGTEEIKEHDKIYNSTSSNGSVGIGSTVSPNNNDNDNEENNEMLRIKKHKFHVVMESEDNIQMQQNNEQNENIHHDDVESK